MKWWRDYNVSRQTILHVICEGICLQIHSGYIFTPEICSGSSSIIPPDRTFSSQTWHSFSYCLMQIKLDWVATGDKRRRARVLNVSDTRGVIFRAKCGAFFFIRRIYHPTWSQDQRNNTFHHIKEPYTDNCDNRCATMSAQKVTSPFLFWI